MNIFSNEKELELRLNELQSKRDNINKLWHIYKTVQVTSIIEEYIQEQLFEKYRIEKIEISVYIDRDNDIPLSVYINFFNERDHEVRNRQGLDDDNSELIKAFKDFQVFNKEYLGEFFQHRVTYPFIIHPGLKEEIIDELLSSELKVLMKHEELQNELPNNGETVKRIKI
jgi:hypothetical protein